MSERQTFTTEGWRISVFRNPFGSFTAIGQQSFRPGKRLVIATDGDSDIAAIDNLCDKIVRSRFVPINVKDRFP